MKPSEALTADRDELRRLSAAYWFIATPCVRVSGEWKVDAEKLLG
jgi:hypothetical protein